MKFQVGAAPFINGASCSIYKWSKIDLTVGAAAFINGHSNLQLQVGAAPFIKGATLQLEPNIFIWDGSTPPYTGHHTGSPGLNCLWGQLTKLLYVQHYPLQILHVTETIDLIGINIHVS